MTPSAWRDGGRGETIRWATAEPIWERCWSPPPTKGICRLSFDEDERALGGVSPKRRSRMAARNGGFGGRTVAAVNAPEKPHDLPLDVNGTAFQERCGASCSKIPAGETRTYAEIAAAVGRPAAVRAAGSANGATTCGADPLPPRHPHRRHPRRLCLGLERKARLLPREARQAQGPRGCAARPPAPVCRRPCLEPGRASRAGSRDVPAGRR